MTVWESLAILDPANTPQERCVHTWVRNGPKGKWTTAHWECTKCGRTIVVLPNTPPDKVGSGVWWCREKYGTFDALRSLAERLGLEWHLGGNMTDILDSVRNHCAQVYPRGGQPSQPVVYDADPVLAFAVAIVRAFGLPEEVETRD